MLWSLSVMFADTANSIDGTTIGLAIGIPGGCAAFYPTMKYILEWWEKRSKRLADAERENVAVDERREEKRLQLTSSIAQVQKELAVALTENKNQTATFQTAITAALDDLTTHVRELTNEVRGNGSYNPRRTRAGRDKPDGGTAPKS